MNIIELSQFRSAKIMPSLRFNRIANTISSHSIYVEIFSLNTIK